MISGRPYAAVMGMGGMPARLDPESLDLDRSLRSRLSRYAVERREPDGSWARIGLFGTAREAADNIDVLAAMHGGAPGDYRVARVGVKRWIAVVGWITLAVVVVVVVAGWVLLAID
jgi:hypothetical protein